MALSWDDATTGRSRLSALEAPSQPSADHPPPLSEQVRVRVAGELVGDAAHRFGVGRIRVHHPEDLAEPDPVVDGEREDPDPIGGARAHDRRSEDAATESLGIDDDDAVLDVMQALSGG